MISNGKCYQNNLSVNIFKQIFEGEQNASKIEFNCMIELINKSGKLSYENHFEFESPPYRNMIGC